MSEEVVDLPTEQNGAPDRSVREQIIATANEHFAHYGYGKTTVSDLARAIGFSKAYIYKFFDSKQAIGEAICSQVHRKISAAAETAIEGGRTSSDKFRRFARAVVEANLSLLFNEGRLYEMAAHSVAERWPSYRHHMDDLLVTLTEIIREGREKGEFERKTPLDATCRAILQAMQPFINPLMLEHNLDVVSDGPNEVADLVLRSLAP